MLYFVWYRHKTNPKRLDFEYLEFTRSSYTSINDINATIGAETETQNTDNVTPST